MLAANLAELMVRVERLGRRSERLGTAPLVLRDSGRRDGRHAVVVLEGEPPALAGWTPAGWTLAAIVAHRDRAPAIRVVSAAAPPLDLARFDEPRCDHCHLRRRRAETFVLWHAATGRVRRVGSGCLRDFLDGHDPERLGRQAEYLLLARHVLSAAADSSGPAVPSSEDVSLERFAAHAATVVRAHGWVSREQARARRAASPTPHWHRWSTRPTRREPRT